MKKIKKLKDVWFEWWGKSYDCPLLMKYDDGSAKMFITKRQLFPLLTFLLENLDLSDNELAKIQKIVYSLIGDKRRNKHFKALEDLVKKKQIIIPKA